MTSQEPISLDRLLEMKQRVSTQFALQGLHDALGVFLDRHKSCVSCENFSDERCLLVKERPPARIIVKGCEQWAQITPF